MKKLWLLAMIMCGFHSASASGVGNGTISFIETIPGSPIAYVTVEGQYDNRPACSTFHRQLFAVDTSTQGGRNTLANAMMARAAGAHVFVRGTGTCLPVPPPNTPGEGIDFLGWTPW